MIKSSNFLILTIVLIVIFPAQLSMYSTDWTKLTGIGLVTFVLLSLFYLLINKKFFFKISLILVPAFVGLICFSITSYLVTGSLKSILVYGALISLFVIMRTLTSEINNLDEFIIKIVTGSCLTGLFIIFVGFKDGFSLNSYSGFFINPNSLGMFSAGLIHMTLGALYAFNNRLSK